MERVIQCDLYRYLNKEYSFRNFLRGMMIPGFRYIYIIRKASKVSKGSISWILYKFLLRRYSHKFGFQIPYTTIIGDGFYIGHIGTIIINQDAVIGKNCNISPGVTIGQTNRGSKSGVPVIGDYVWMGTNSVMVGGIIIGNDVMIAPGSFVNFDVPDHSIVIGNPGKIISRAQATESYIEFIRPDQL